MLAALSAPAELPLRAAKRDAWVEVRSPNFIIVSNAGEKQARKTAIQFEQIHTLFRESLAVAQGRPSPVITVFAVKDEKSLSDLVPEYWTKGHAHLSGIFWNRMSQYYAAVNLDAQGSNPYATMYHEYYHSLTVPYFPDLPVWLSEGLADFFGHSEINGNTAMMGMPDAGLIEVLRQNKAIPLDVLFHVDTSSPYYNEQNKTSVFYAESWALTHYLMVGDNQSHRQMLLDYAGALSSGATEDQAAAKAFGDLKKLQEQLSRYIGRYTFNFFTTKAPAEPSVAEIHTRMLSDAEEEAYRGGFFAIRARPEAEQILQNAVNLDPKLALAHQNLALAEFFAGNRDSALESVREAIQLDPQNGFAHYLRAYLVVSGAGGFPQDAQVEADLRASISANPDFAPSYALLGIYLSNRQQSLDEAFRVAKKAAELEPGNSNYMYDLARVLAQMHRYDEAQFVALHARASARNPQDRANAEAFLAFLQKVRSADAGLAPASTSHEAVKSADNSKPDSSSEDTVPSDAAPAIDNSREVTGIVAQESCVGGLKVQLTTTTDTLTLRLQAGAPSAIHMMSKPAANFDICTSLKGTRVTARYVPDEPNKNSGTIQRLTILDVDAPARAKSSRPADARTPLRVEPGEKRAATVNATISGKVTAVSCDGNEMKLTLAVRESEFDLHARDYTRVHFEQSVPFDTGQFQPCTQLRDHDATVEYIVTEKENYDGEIQSVEVGK
jgi:tetratricopeptide (TPR) repeat protein